MDNSCGIVLDAIFERSRFDYAQWIPDAHEDESGWAVIGALMSSYNQSSLEDAGSINTVFGEQRWLGSGHGRVDCGAAMEDLSFFCHSLDADRPALEFPADSYMYTDEELARLNDGRTAGTDLYDNLFENIEDDIADNCAIAEGLNEQAKPKKRGGRRHKSHFMKRPMALAEVILDLLDSERRENSLRCLSGHLIERREKDVDFYRTAAYQLYYSCSTLAILIQEVISGYERINVGDLNVRGSKRLANVLTCFQSIAASDETRFPFVRAKIPNLLQPFILSTFTEEVYENVRAISLSVIDLTCKNCERDIIQWALETDVLQSCLYAIEIGSRLSKLIAMSILESILHDEMALEVICREDSSLVLDIVKMLSYLVAILGVVQDFSRRLIFQVVRCYTLMCQHPRALELVRDNFPRQLENRTFHELKQVYPVFRTLVHQLLLCIGKVDTCIPQESPSDSETLTTPSPTSQTYGKENTSSDSTTGRKRRTQDSRSFSKSSPRTPGSTPYVQSPLRPLDLNKEHWYRLPANFEYDQSLVPHVD